MRLGAIWCGGEEKPALDGVTLEVRRGDFLPVTLKRGGKPFDFTFAPIIQYENACECAAGESFSALLDGFFAEREQADRVRQKGQDLLKTAANARDRLRRKLAMQEQEYQKTLDRDELRINGELITANLYRMERGMARLEAENYYEEGCPKRVIALDVRLSPQENAAKYFKRYSKAKTAEKMLARLMEQGRAELLYLESVVQEIAQAESEQDFNDIRAELTEGGYIRSHGKKQAGFQRKSEPRRFRTEAGFLVLVGRSNRQNDKLTGKTADRNDYWFHTQKIHGSHVILCTEGREPDEGSILQAAQLAAVLNKYIAGHTPEEITLPVMMHAEEEMGSRAELLSIAMKEIFGGMEEQSGGTLAVDGVERLLEYPEYADIGKLRGLLGAIEQKEGILDTISHIDGDDLGVVIGRENGEENLSDTTMVVKKIKKNGKVVGAIGIIGPCRMDYAKVMPIVSALAESVGTVLSDERQMLESPKNKE